MNEERDLEKMYAKLEHIHGDSIEEKAAEAHRKADQRNMSVQICTDSNNNPLRINVAIGPHHFIEIGLVNGKVHVFKGETHHGTSMKQRLWGASGNRFPLQNARLPTSVLTRCPTTIRPSISVRQLTI